MQARGEFFGILMPPPPLGGILPTASMMMGRCEPHTATFECFPCPLGLLRWCITLQLCLPPPNNNEGWPPCGVHNRAACHPFSTRLSEVWSWTWQTPNVQVQLVSGPDLGSGPGPNLVMNSPKKISLKQAKEHIFWTITHKDMDKTIKFTENSRCT